MTIAKIKEKLHAYIEVAEERKLKAIYILLEHDMDNHDFDDETVKMLEERHDEFIKSGSKGYTVEESFECIKNNMKSATE